MCGGQSLKKHTKDVTPVRALECERVASQPLALASNGAGAGGGGNGDDDAPVGHTALLVDADAAQLVAVNSGYMAVIRWLHHGAAGRRGRAAHCVTLCSITTQRTQRS